jgi:predicted porin
VAKYHLLDLGQIKLSFVVFGDLRMKKLLIATAALAMVAGTAQAQSSVTVYGVVDVSYGENDTGVAGAKTKTKGLADSANASSRFGVRGTEDLGGGLSAGFTLEAGLNITNGAQFNKSNTTPVTTAADATTTGAQTDSAVFGAATRQAFITLGSANTGTVLVGYKKQLESDFNDTFMIGTENSFGAEGQELSRVGRANQIGYTFPSFAKGLTVSAAHTVAASNTEGDATKTFDASITSMNVMYKSGALTVGGHIGSGTVDIGTNFDANTTLQTVGAFTTDVKNDYDTQGVGVSYNFGPALVSAMYGKREVGLAGASTVDYSNIGVAIPMGKTTLKASISDNKEKNAAGVEQQKNKGFQLQADYSLSKRTTAWVVYGDNEKTASNVKTDSTTMRVGATHSF